MAGPLAKYAFAFPFSNGTSTGVALITFCCFSLFCAAFWQLNNSAKAKMVNRFLIVFSFSNRRIKIRNLK